MRFLLLFGCLVPFALALSDDIHYATLHISLFSRESSVRSGHIREIPASAVLHHDLRTRPTGLFSRVVRPNSPNVLRRGNIVRQGMPLPSIGPIPEDEPQISSPFSPEEDGPETSPNGSLFCFADSDCVGDSICVPEGVPGLGFCAKDEFCFCIAIPPPTCISTGNCDKEEVCVELNEAYNLCVADNVFNASLNLQFALANGSPEPQPLFCEGESDCPNSTCIPEGELALTCGPGKFCFCASESFCFSGMDCPGNDVCVLVIPFLILCVDEQVYEASSQLLKLPDNIPESSPSIDSGMSVFCESNVECGGGVCIFANGTFAQPCSKSDHGPCFCLAVPVPFCSEFNSCPSEDQVCTALSIALTTCISELVIESSEFFVPIPLASPEPFDLEPSPNEMVEESPSFSGPPVLFCETDSDCLGWCIPETNRSLGICSPGDFCFCIPVPPPPCNSSSQCDAGEVCVLVSDSVTLCVNEEVFDTSTQLLKAPENLPEGSPSVDEIDSVFCEDDSECGAGICISSDGTFVKPCVGKGTCFCLSVPVHTCDVFNTICDFNEVCTVLSPIFTVCLSETVVENSDSLEQLPKFSPQVPLLTSEAEIESTPESEAQFGLTGGTCGLDSDCQGKRSCVELKQLGMPCSRTGRCICIPPQLTMCTSSSSCVGGEICATSSAGGNAVCVSERLVKSVDGFIEVEVDL